MTRGREPRKALRVGTTVRYKGGSRAKGIAAGARGVVKDVWPNKNGAGRYVIRFKKKTCAVAWRFVTEVNPNGKRGPR